MIDSEDDCKIQQENEIMAIKAIYEQDFTYTENSIKAPRYRGALSIKISFPQENLIFFTGGRNVSSDPPLKVRYLPPVKIIFAMPSDYPNQKPLEFELECLWMRWDWLKKLERKLLQIWEEKKDVVLDHFAEFIQNEALDYLQITFPLRLNDDYIGGSMLKTIIHTYNQQAMNQDFVNDHFTCGICLEEKRGERCFQLRTCQHVFCQECLREYFIMLIREGFILQIKCPDPGCKSQHKLTVDEVTEIVGVEMGKRYSDLLEKQKLETDPLMTFCPRIICQAPVKKDSNFEKLCICTKCTFAFCWFCQRTWHGASTPCHMDHTKKIVEEYMNADESTKAVMELRYGAKNLEKLVRDATAELETDKWVKSNTQPCPQCETPIEKSMGCNHMLCTRCETHFCYLCGHWIDPKEPYQHFNDSKSPCNQRLFDGVNVDDFDIPDDFVIV
ncbi:RWD-domain-containing protein [Gigaspora margarita]|uniref:RBR-type E3 ubiquitin transferase n=4 Tax=Gigaspora margarita TaxID=4874 RepID=A0A8H4EMZ2_GIGMA|nr:RWD-domain-containing protein [Gigaspora margarita]